MTNDLRARPKLWLWGVLLVVAGFAAIHTAHAAFAEISIWHHVLRDVGIALFVSAAVTLLYEAYFRWLVDLHKIDTILTAVYGSHVPEAVWGNIKDTLTKRDVLRNDSELRLSVFRVDAHEWLLLKIEHGYKLGGLWHKRREVRIEHTLDDDIKPAGGGRPRFTHVSLNDQTTTVPPDGTLAETSTAAGRIAASSSKLTIHTHVESMAREDRLRVRTHREEFRRCPGLYYFVMTEIADGIDVSVADCPADIALHITVYPQGNKARLSPAENPRVRIDDILLPGHCLEFKFTTIVPS